MQRYKKRLLVFLKEVFMISKVRCLYQLVSKFAQNYRNFVMIEITFISQAKPRYYWSILFTILRGLFGLWGRTPPTVLKLGPWNFQHSWPMVWGCTAREDFWVSPPQPAPGSKRCSKSMSGGPYAYSRAFFAKYMLLGIVQGVKYILWIFISDSHRELQAQKGVPKVGLEALLLTLKHSWLNTCC